ncbi:MAG: transcriptional regulator [Bacteroidetes bacterium GWF2_42_66]|nr:MAG: transcriptional regulator [Bacteroidetes bacterium GWA2_42_15]OFY01483.1 MAG: transcriptional regulator [Bacteroidetes bacterium GWE2_42_39]OFY43336.1 MAG: transcriptional regulator [Bacteroidetes bacterium GWF2_42_66]HBL77481.1 transcriptional regulator [Prolixibacteraceae bacterium]HCR91294.1 transcriptional regulator [Prolixibacteraceae bacterium]
MRKSLTQPMTMDEAKDHLLGKKGSPERDAYELELKVEMLGATIKCIRKEQNLTQEKFGEKIGVTKSQVSRIEANTPNVNLQTIIKVLRALGKELTFNIR